MTTSVGLAGPKAVTPKVPIVGALQSSERSSIRIPSGSPLSPRQVMPYALGSNAACLYSFNYFSCASTFAAVLRSGQEQRSRPAMLLRFLCKLCKMIGWFQACRDDDGTFFSITKSSASATSLHRKNTFEVHAEHSATLASSYRSTQASAISGGQGFGVIAAPKHCDRVCEIDVPSWLLEWFAAMA